MSGEPTFTPPVNPSFPIGIDKAPKTFEVPFGDGYTERVIPGINSNPASVDLKWENVTEEERDEIDAFFEARAGVEAFYYQPRGFSAPKKWLCKSWKSDLKDPDAWDVTAKLNQCYDP